MYCSRALILLTFKAGLLLLFQNSFSQNCRVILSEIHCATVAWAYGLYTRNSIYCNKNLNINKRNLNVHCHQRWACFPSEPCHQRWTPAFQTGDATKGGHTLPNWALLPGWTRSFKWVLLPEVGTCLPIKHCYQSWARAFQMGAATRSEHWSFLNAGAATRGGDADWKWARSF